MYIFVQAYAAAGTVSQNYASILLMLLRLRQACDHPLLVKGFNSDSIRKGSVDVAKSLERDRVIDLLNRFTTTTPICTMCSVSFLATLVACSLLSRL